MDALQMQSPGDSTVSGPVYSIFHNSGRTERGLAHGGTAGRQNKTCVTDIHKSSHNPADRRDKNENRAASLSQSVSWALPGFLPTWRQGGSWPQARQHSYPGPAPASVV